MRSLQSKMVSNADMRQAIGAKLKEFRESRGLSLYRVAVNGGIPVSAAKSVEEGSKSYTIDTFIGYIRGCDLYIFFGERSADREMPHDFGDMLESMERNQPK